MNLKSAARVALAVPAFLPANNRPHRRNNRSRLAPRQGIPEQQASAQMRSRQQEIACSSYVIKGFSRFSQWRRNVFKAVDAPQHPARGKCGGSPCVVLRRLRPIQPDNDDDPTDSQKTLKTFERGSQRKVVQYRNGGDEIEAAVDERVGHRVTLDKGDPRVRQAGCPSIGDHAFVGIDRDNVVASLCKPPGEQASAASHVEGAPGTRRNRTQHEIMIVNIVIPWPRAHRYLNASRLG